MHTGQKFEFDTYLFLYSDLIVAFLIIHKLKNRVPGPDRKSMRVEY